MSRKQLTLLLAVPLFLLATPAQAYIGPGVGAGTVAVVLGILASVGMAFFALLWYPLKRVFKRRKAGSAGTADEGLPS